MAGSRAGYIQCPPLLGTLLPWSSACPTALRMMCACVHRAAPLMPASIPIYGLLYDVATGRMETVTTSEP